MDVISFYALLSLAVDTAKGGVWSELDILAELLTLALDNHLVLAYLLE